MAGKSALLSFVIALSVLASILSPASAGPYDRQGGGRPGFDRQQMRQELMTMPADQRHERMQQFREQAQQQHSQMMGQRQQQLRDRWGRATPQQRQKFCGTVGPRCASDGDLPVCQTAQQLCGGH